MTELELRNGLARDLTKVVRVFKKYLILQHETPMYSGPETWRISAGGTDLYPIAVKLYDWWLTPEGRKYAASHDHIDERMAGWIPLRELYGTESTSE